MAVKQIKLGDVPKSELRMVEVSFSEEEGGALWLDF